MRNVLQSHTEVVILKTAYDRNRAGQSVSGYNANYYCE